MFRKLRLVQEKWFSYKRKMPGKWHTGIPGLWMQVLDAGLWTLDFGCWTLYSALWTLDSGRWTLDPRRYTFDAGLWTLDTVVDCCRTESELIF